MRKRTTPRVTARQRGDYRRRKGDGEGGRERSEVIIRVNLPSYALQPRNDTAMGARADQGPEMYPRNRSRLVERAAVGEGR
jgi:hypothetical protein